MIKNTIRLRTYASLYLNCVIILMVVLATIWMMTDWVSSSNDAYAALGSEALKYFTVDSNLFMGFASAVIVVSNVLKLLGKELKYGKFIAVLNLAAVTGITLTFLVVVCFLAPHSPFGFWTLYLESNLFFHLIIPILAIIDFLFLSDNERFRWPWCFVAIVPEVIYGIFYCIPVVRFAMPNGEIARGYDWYGFFGNNISHLIPRLLLLVVLILFLCFFLWGLLELRALLLRKLQLGKKQTSNFNSVSESLESEVATASEYYLTNIIRIICIVAPVIGNCAGIIFTTLWLTGNFPFSFTSILIFDCICESYLIIALFLFNTCIGKNGIIITSKVRFGKIALTLLLLLQWNLISYIAPFRDFWAYSLLFVLISALFLDSKLVLINIVAHSASIILSLFLKGENLLPLFGNDFISSIVFRIALLFLGFSVIYLMVLLIEKMLLNTLDKLSDYDVLTHALNRRQLSRNVSDAIDSFQKNGDIFCLAIFDLDDFKKINDTYGHTSGDEVLVEFVRVINSAVTSSDYVFRYGGEEFLVLYKCPLEKAVNSCQRILRGLRATHFQFLTEGDVQTATVGIAQYAEGMSAEEAIILADERLYFGKQHGKNQVVSL